MTQSQLTIIGIESLLIGALVGTAWFVPWKIRTVPQIVYRQTRTVYVDRSADTYVKELQAADATCWGEHIRNFIMQPNGYPTFECE